MDEEQLTITVEPIGTATALLNAEEALRHVLDVLKITDAAAASAGDRIFEWRLLRATTNSPFTVVAVAAPLIPGALINEQVLAAKRIAARAFDELARGAPAPAWLSAKDADRMLAFYRRNAKGIDITKIDFGGEFGLKEVTQERALIAIPALEPPLGQGMGDIPARTVDGELEGRMVAVGRYHNRPAFQMTTPLYGSVWCVIPDDLVDQLGDEQTLSDVWKGKRVVAFGKMTFQKEGRLGRMNVVSFRQKEIPATDIANVLDGDFTAGMDPVSYLESLHGGTLG